jgi:hypothetical protein
MKDQSSTAGERTRCRGTEVALKAASSHSAADACRELIVLTGKLGDEQQHHICDFRKITDLAEARRG